MVKNMAVTTFIPQVWNARLLHNFYERSRKKKNKKQNYEAFK